MNSVKTWSVPYALLWEELEKHPCATQAFYKENAHDLFCRTFTPSIMSEEELADFLSANGSRLTSHFDVYLASSEVTPEELYSELTRAADFTVLTHPMIFARIQVYSGTEVD
ncbi:MAG TPA: hypothetical protein PKY30_15080 [Myxococcota bacterium]|nr:hypothetical protein [Myxococcota bacterium]